MKRPAWVATGALAVLARSSAVRRCSTASSCFRAPGPSIRRVQFGVGFRFKAANCTCGCQVGSSSGEWSSRHLRAALLWERRPPGALGCGRSEHVRRTCTGSLGQDLHGSDRRRSQRSMK